MGADHLAPLAVLAGQQALGGARAREDLCVAEVARDLVNGGESGAEPPFLLVRIKP